MIKRKKKIFAILLAYNAEKTLENFYKEFPKELFDKIILVDDASKDKTFHLAKRLGITSFRNTHNLGYGGNMKRALDIGLKLGGDIFVDIHPDGEYKPSAIPSALKKINEGALLVLGNRFFKFDRPLKSGMYIWKYIPIRILNSIDSLFLGLKIKDFHQGFRVYTRELLKTINFKANSSGYLFSFEIIAQAAFAKLPIAQVPVETLYTGKKRGATLKKSVGYSLGTFKVIFLFLLAKVGFISKMFDNPKTIIFCPNCQENTLSTTHETSNNEFIISYCERCLTGITFPFPRSLSKYYHRNYWKTSGLFGKIKDFLFEFFQRRRAKWVNEYLHEGNILDVGSGEGKFGKRVADIFNVVNIDFPGSKIKNPDVKKVDFLKFKTKNKFDGIVFWESLEHTKNPQMYLENASRLIKKNGLVFIEYPRFNSIESNLFGKHWFHLDVPRHLFHLTDKGLNILLKRAGLFSVKHFRVSAFEYTIWGFAASILDIFGIKPTDKLKKYHNLAIIFSIIPIIMLSFIFEVVFLIFKQSPIGLVVARKKS